MIPIPSTTALEEPTTCVRINELWIPVLLGALQHYLNPPQWELGQRGPYMVNPENVWEGDATANEEAEQQILEIMATLMAGNCEEEPLTIPPGTIQMYVGNVAPSGWLLCDASQHLKEDYPDLWDVLSQHGTQFQASSTTFVTPEMRQRSPIGYNPSNPTYDQIGDILGSATHTLTVNEMPQHAHAPLSGSAFVTNTNPTASSWHFVTSGGVAVQNANGGGTTANAGGGAAHNNLHPVLVVNFIIKT